MVKFTGTGETTKSKFNLIIDCTQPICEEKVQVFRMHKRKRFRSMAGSEENSDLTNSNYSDAEEPRQTGIDDLPDEMLVKIFSQLGHGDKLCSRLVNQRWCRVMTSWKGFKGSVKFLVQEKSHERAIETLSKSKSCWSSLRFEWFRLDVNRLDDIRVLNEAVNNVTSLEIFACPSKWATMKPVLVLFSKLKSLSIIYDTDERKAKSSEYVLVERDDELLQERWNDLVKNLRRLSLVLRTFSSVARFLPQFKGLNNLLKLVVRQNGHDPRDDLQPAAREAAVEDLYQIISASGQTLEVLKITLDPGDVKKQLLPNLVKRLTHLNLDLVEFDLQHVHESPLPYDEGYLQILQRFVSSQTDLERVTLPEFHGCRGPLRKNLRVLVTNSIPGTATSLEFNDKHYLEKNILDKFPHLYSLEIASEIDPYVTTDKTYCNMRYLRCELSSDSALGWSTAFPNLIYLNLTQFGANREMRPFNDLTLQVIIKNFKRLKCLTLDFFCGSISDYGVTGIKKEYCKYLSETRALNVDVSHEVPAEFRTGLPLCSLTGLHSLSINFSCLDITDVGILFGFAFKELRKLQIALNRRDYRNPARVTDWGFDLLGKLNPNLERCAFELESERTISLIGRDSFLARMRRIKDHRHNLKSEEIESMLRSPLDVWEEDSEFESEAEIESE